MLRHKMLIFLEIKTSDGTACQQELAPVVWIRKQEETKDLKQTQKKKLLIKWIKKNQPGSRRIPARSTTQWNMEMLFNVNQPGIAKGGIDQNVDLCWIR